MHHIRMLKSLCRQFGQTPDTRRPIPRLWIHSAEVWGGNVVRRMGTQQQQSPGNVKKAQPFLWTSKKFILGLSMQAPLFEALNLINSMIHSLFSFSRAAEFKPGLKFPFELYASPHKYHIIAFCCIYTILLL